MEMYVEYHQGKVPVTLLKISGNLDGSNYKEVIAKGNELFQAGTRDLVIDLSDVAYISSAGLVSLHRVALTMRGESSPEPEAGWNALREMSDDVESGKQKHLKLLCQQVKIQKILETAGFINFLDVYTDTDEAVNSFK